MSTQKLEGLPDREQLVKAVEAAQAAHRAQSTANDLKSKAQQMMNSTEREQMLREAYEKEIEAHGHSKMAKRLQSGAWQGFGFGGGIGAATGMGLGAGLGTLLGAVTAVPATALGMLIGTGVGAVHGPWVKLGGKEQKFEDADPGEVVDAIQEEENSQRRAEMEQRVAAGDNAPVDSKDGEEKQRRKPPKLEIRSQGNPKSKEQLSTPTTNDTHQNTIDTAQQPRKKPKKLEIRSGKARNDVPALK